MTIKERRPGIKKGSIHCPVRQLNGLIERKDVAKIAHMIRQLRAGYADPSYSDYDKGEFLWLGKRYAAAYTEITGAPLPSGEQS